MSSSTTDQRDRRHEPRDLMVLTYLVRLEIPEARVERRQAHHGARTSSRVGSSSARMRSAYAATPPCRCGSRANTRLSARNVDAPGRVLVHNEAIRHRCRTARASATGCSARGPLSKLARSPPTCGDARLERASAPSAAQGERSSPFSSGGRDEAPPAACLGRTAARRASTSRRAFEESGAFALDDVLA